jgi:hypothetical protein
MLSLSLETHHKRPRVAIPLPEYHCCFIAVAAVFYDSDAALVERRVVPSYTKTSTLLIVQIRLQHSWDFIEKEKWNIKKRWGRFMPCKVA